MSLVVGVNNLFNDCALFNVFAFVVIVQLIIDDKYKLRAAPILNS